MSFFVAMMMVTVISAAVITVYLAQRYTEREAEENSNEEEHNYNEESAASSNKDNYDDESAERPVKRSKEVNVQVENCKDEFYFACLKDPLNVYPVRHSPKAHVLILNNYKGFKGGPQDNRHKSKRDVELMKQLWEGFQCKVIVKENQTAKKMLESLSKFLKSDIHEKCDFCVVFIMSHGDLVGGQDAVCGIDDEYIPTEDIVKLFHNLPDRPYLIGKPKLIFFQSCRGGSAPPGVLREVTADSTNAIGFSSKRPGVTARVRKKTERLPEGSDILVAFSTVKGALSFCDIHDGSYFINAIAKVFSKKAKTEHVADMLTEVRNLVSKETINYPKKKIYFCNVSAECQDRLRKKLYLFPGFPERKKKFRFLWSF